MAQFGRPTSVVTQGTWTGSYTAIDEITANDADFVYSANGASDYMEVALNSMGDPNASTGHTIRLRCARVNNGVLDGGGSAVNAIVDLYQGTTLIGTFSDIISAVGAFHSTNFTLSAAQADAITNYADLRFRLKLGGGGGSPANRRGIAYSWIEFETPDPPPFLVSATMEDADRNYETFAQDITLTFSAAVQITPAPNVGDVIAGLTADIDFSSSEDTVTYVSGNGTTVWKVRIVPSINGQSEIFSSSGFVMMDYVPASGNILGVSDGVELAGFTDTVAENNLSTVIWERIKNKDGINLNTVEVRYALFHRNTDVVTNADWMTLEQKGTLITTADGIVSFAYTGASGPGTSGGDKYLVIIHPHSGPTESLIWFTRVR